MNVYKTIYRLQERCGWDDHSVLGLVLDYLENQAPAQLRRRVIEYLEHQADDEDSPEGTNG